MVVALNPLGGNRLKNKMDSILRVGRWSESRSSTATSPTPGTYDGMRAQEKWSELTTFQLMLGT